MARVVIVGSGLMGTAMAWPLLDNGHSVAIVGTHLDDWIIDSLLANRYHPTLMRKVPPKATFHYIHELPSVIQDADIVVNGVSSFGIHWIADTLSAHLSRGQQVVSLTKGLLSDEQGRVVYFPDYIYDKLSPSVREGSAVVAVGGPCIAGELAARRETCVMFGSRNRAAAKRCAALFGTSYYHVFPTDDVMTLELGVALKNAYTVAVGIAYGMHTPDEADMGMHNTAAALFAQGCHEMGYIIKKLGGDERQSSALPGAGDLFVTSAGGRTMTLGRLLGEGKSYGQAKEVLEGVTLESVQIINEMATVLEGTWIGEYSIDAGHLPLLRTLVDVIVHNKPVEFRYESFFTAH